MKKVALSALAAAMMSGVVYADTMTLYTDPKTGQVFTTAGEGRVEMGDFIDAKTVDMADREQSSALSEYQDKMKKYVNVKSKAKTLEFSGTHYLGYTYASPTNESGTVGDSAGFEMRRNYVQVKGYFNDTDYVRVTLDATKELAQNADSSIDPTKYSPTAQTSGYPTVWIKYAYLWLDEVLPYTGVEAGIAHRPWIDYEEHNGWFYRSFNKVVLEEKGTRTEAGVDLINSADFGVNFRTKTDHFSSEIGIFNGEGYHADKGAANQNNSRDMSLEWRLTGHLIGDGKQVGKYDRTKDTYAHLSTYGMISKNHKDDKADIDQVSSSALKGQYDRAFYGIHTVYNQPEFLIAAQYFTAKDEAQDQATVANWGNRDYKGWSINTEIRPMTDWTIIGRYDDYKWEDKTVAGSLKDKIEGSKIMAGLAYKYNKNVTFIGTGKWIDEEKNGVKSEFDKDVYMLTTELKW